MDAPGPAAPDNPFWDYSLALYGEVAVAEACLALQERRDLNVNLLLFCCWQASRGVCLASEDLQALLDSTANWQRDVVVPLRALRRGLKARAWPEAKALRQQIKTCELEAERLEQAQLFQHAGPAADASIPSTAVANLLAYCCLAGFEPTERDRDDLAGLLAAAVSPWSVDQALSALAAAGGTKRQT